MLFLSFVAVYSFFFFGLSTGISWCLQYLLQLDKFNTFRGKEKKEKIKSTRPPSIDENPLASNTKLQEYEISLSRMSQKELNSAFETMLVNMRIMRIWTLLQVFGRCSFVTLISWKLSYIKVSFYCQKSISCALQLCVVNCFVP